MAKKKYVILKKKLKNLYCKQKLSIFKIAKIFNCTTGTIINRMREYGIKRRHSGPKRISISEKSLYELYIKKGFSSKKIAKICHCEQTAVLNRLRKYGISIRHPKEKLDIPKEELKKLYTKQKLSAYKIAKIYLCGSGTSYRYLRLYKIKTRPLKRIQITKNQLEKLYLKKKLSLSKIANIHKCCPAVILDKMRRYKIPRRTISETSTRHIKSDFSGKLDEKAYMIGFRIGDLGVRKDYNLINIGCGTTKEDQVELIKTVFGPFGPIYVGNKDKRGAVHVGCSLNSSFSFLLPKYNLIPKWILRNKKNFFSFLAGYTDAEGNIGFCGRRAKFRIRSYDKEVLRDINKKLNRFNIKSLFRLDKKSGIDKRGVSRHKDSWAVIVNERKSLLKLFNYLKPLIKHKKRKKDLLNGLKNVIFRLK
ncbi:LAGLIDADG family homing endonuclease [Patescibacteria group bacterium]|nr:LAGLIDADG family homing endonuclease [Patescibacteria group bacterium]MBU4274542.1 LAGLIDADG family homing endonuclease [Patescibacteria group bacterium]MBU4367447.1 LAGLIDADG family homing endonuclease [Patescibacteria group bacterium]MBU4461767.1 LAGLIDADG family homing endonuclease [Patescibacteria group bacterium]MCG2700151.1 LAGLIDADG family homing endonuclease [Candidatus Parcubacteria bacterium]